MIKKAAPAKKAAIPAKKAAPARKAGQQVVVDKATACFDGAGNLSPTKQTGGNPKKR